MDGQGQSGEKPTAIPSTAAMTGFLVSRRPLHRSSRYRTCRADSPSKTEVSFRSAPAVATPTLDLLWQNPSGHFQVRSTGEERGSPRYYDYFDFGVSGGLGEGLEEFLDEGLRQGISLLGAVEG